jgi:hypothetical protein
VPSICDDDLAVGITVGWVNPASAVRGHVITTPSRMRCSMSSKATLSRWS